MDLAVRCSRKAVKLNHSLTQLLRLLSSLLGLKRYAQTTIRYDTRYGAHDMICSAIHLPFLAGKQRLVFLACDQKHRTPPITCAAGLGSNTFYQIQIQIQKFGFFKYKYKYFAQVWFKYKYKYKYIDSNTNTNTFNQIYLPKTVRIQNRAIL